jgi:hypothetical protein
MRMRLAVVLAVMTGLLAREAAACSTGACRRWFGLEPTRAVFPRDAAIVLEGSLHAEVCAPDLREHASVVVRRGDEVVAGTFDAPVSLVHELVWYPEALLEPGDYTLSVTIDNAGLDVPGGESCGDDVYSESLAFSVEDAASPTAPIVVPPPVFAGERRRLDGGWRSIACCPGVVPIEGFAGDCEPGIGTAGYAGDCIYFYDFEYLTITTDPFPYEDGHGELWLYQLVVDGELVDRGLHGTRARISHRACAHVEAIHLGSGEVVGSEVACPPDDLVIGPTEHAPEFELTCDQALACGTADGWDPEQCQPYTKGQPPWEPVDPLPDTKIETACEAPAPMTMPVYPADEGGCGCAQAQPQGLLLVALVLRRRRRR